MKEMTELKMVYELVISRANPLDKSTICTSGRIQRKFFTAC